MPGSRPTTVIRFLVVAPERADLVRFKIARSPLLRDALDAGTWHIVKSDQLRAFLARDPLDLGGPGAVPRPRPERGARRRADAPVRPLTGARDGDRDATRRR